MAVTRLSDDFGDPAAACTLDGCGDAEATTGLACAAGEGAEAAGLGSATGTTSAARSADRDALEAGVAAEAGAGIPVAVDAVESFGWLAVEQAALSDSMSAPHATATARM
jgi:hypothetical protein